MVLDDLSELFVADADTSAAIARFNATTATFADGLIDELIRAAPWPGTALCCQFGELTMNRDTFLQRAEALAGWLQGQGVRRGSIVGIVMTPSPARLMALYAAMRAGAVALPIDHSLPDDRIGLYLADSRCSAVVIDANQSARVWVAQSPVLVTLPPDGDAGLPPAAVQRDPARSAADWCYVVYTSGTTGRPKAAINNHRALVNRLEWMARDIAVTATDRVCHKTPFGFDVSVWEQLLPLLTGVPVIIAPDQLRREPAALLDFFAENRVTISHFVPSQLGEFVACAQGEPPGGLRCIVASGEALPVATAAAVLAWSGVALHNYYGPSEAAIDVTGWTVTGALGHDIAIGAPIQNGTIRVLDPLMHELPIGAAGEIYIGGIPVGDGYLHAPRNSAERFVPDPFSPEPGARLYRTGDIGHWGADGMIRFMGRNDRQLKLRGLRIEPGEIESQLVAVTGQSQCLVEPVLTPGGQAILIGFVVTPGWLDEDAVLAALAQSLPAYMVPARIIALPRLPISGNGKADTRALQALAEQALLAMPTGAQPLSGPAQVLADLWTVLLGRPVTSGAAHFFKLGGDSITAIRLVARVRAEGYKIETQDVFDHPVLADLASAMIPLATTAVALSVFAAAIRSASVYQRLGLVPQCVIAADSAAQSAVLTRLAQLAGLLRPDQPQPSVEALGAAGSPPAVLRIAQAADLAVACDLGSPGLIVAAFDPACLDHASMGPIAAWLVAGGQPPRIERSVLQQPPLPAEPDHPVNWPVGTPKSATFNLDEAPDYWTDRASWERSSDWIAAQILSVLVVDAPGGGVLARLPESATAAMGSGIAPDQPVGRFGLVSSWFGTSPPGVATIASLRGAGAGAGAPPITDHPAKTINLYSAPGSPATAATILAAPVLARGEIAFVITDQTLTVVWTDQDDGWLQPALAALRRTDLVPPKPWLAQRFDGDFPLTTLSGQQLANLSADYGSVQDCYPLAPLQEGMMMRAAYWPESDAYLNQNIIELRGSLDPAHVTSAWLKICQRYEILRSAYRWQDLPRPLAVVTGGSVNAVEHLDWQALPEPDFEAQLAEFLDADRAVPFDLGMAGLWRLRLIRRAPDHHVIVWTHHHILLDGWCLALIWGDFAKAFEAAARPGPAVMWTQPRPYRDYIAWLTANPPGDATMAYWDDRLAGAQACAFSAGTVDTEGLAATLRVPLPAARKAALDQACAALGLTANAFIQASWSLLLSLRLGRRDVTHGVSISGRPPEMAGSEAMVGLFINLIPLRLGANPGQTAAAFLQAVQTGLAAANRHGTLPLPEILSRWQGRATPDQRLFDSLIAFENYPDENLPTSSVAGVEFVDRFCDEKTEYPIGLIVLPGDPFEVHFNYDTVHFSAAAIAAIRDDYLGLLNRFIDHPDSPLASFELASCQLGRADEVQALEPVELAQLLAPDPSTDHLIALGGQGRSWTRAELRAVVDRVATAIAPPDGSPGIAICAHRSTALAIAVYAAWRRGLVPTVINPALPDDAIVTLLQASGCRLVLADHRTAPRLQRHGGTLLDLARVVQQAEDGAFAPWSGSAVCTTAAILLTSGTAGTPKRVLVPARGFAQRLAWTRQLYALDQPRLLANAAPGFDIGLWELAWPLACGGAVLIADDDDVLDPALLACRLRDDAITALHVTPTFAAGFADLPGTWRDVRLVITGGEVVTAERVRALARKLPEARIYQGYGPTEASVSVIDSWLDPANLPDPLPLGRPMPGCSIRILDSALRPCAIGAVGTLHIAGLPLGDGYPGDPRQTAAAFLPDPAGPPGSRMYDTGDQASWLPDGTVRFSGRIDRQVKVRGFRIELDAIERVLGSHPLVRNAGVICRNDAAGQPAVLAFAALTDGLQGAGPDAQALRAWLARQLPRWAVPQTVTVLDQMPQSSNGKINYAALELAAAAPLAVPQQVAPLVPANEAERQIAACWEAVTGRPPESRHANFFEAGGHSMTAMRLVSQLQVRLALPAQIRVPLFFKFPTVAGFAEALLTNGQTGAARHLACIGTGAGVPLILVHPVEGLSHAYHPLAKALAGHAVWTIEDPRFDRTDRFATLHDMAELYVEWVRNHFEGQPVLLGGWSFGGVVALEMAAIMARHAAPPGVILIDSYNFAGHGADPRAFARGALDQIDALAGIDAQTLAALHGEILSNTCLALASGTGSYDHPVTLLQATVQDAVITAQLGPANGWTRRCPQLRTIRVAADHQKILRAPAVAQAITGWLSAAGVGIAAAMVPL